MDGAFNMPLLSASAKNDASYTLGNRHDLTAWASYLWTDWISTPIRVKSQKVSQIDGRDPRITAPVQTADPKSQGCDRIDMLAGFNLVGQSSALGGHRVALELGVPIYQDLNGSQLESDWRLLIG